MDSFPVWNENASILFYNMNIDLFLEHQERITLGQVQVFSSSRTTNTLRPSVVSQVDPYMNQIGICI